MYNRAARQGTARWCRISPSGSTGAPGSWRMTAPIEGSTHVNIYVAQALRARYADRLDGEDARTMSAHECQGRPASRAGLAAVAALAVAVALPSDGAASLAGSPSGG